MTDEELRQWAREQIAKEYWEIHYSLSSEAFTWVKAKLTNEDIDGAYNFADAILALKKPDGTPAIGIISDEQSVKFREFYNDWGGESGKMGYKQAVGDMKETGFYRLVGGKK